MSALLDKESQLTDCCIIGGGISGVKLAHELDKARWRVDLLEKARGLGGRMSTRRVTLGTGQALFDHGASEITAEGRALSQQIEQWQRSGILQQSSEKNRYFGKAGMSQVVRNLCPSGPSKKHTGFKLHLSQKVEKLSLVLDEGHERSKTPTHCPTVHWKIKTAAGLEFSSRILVSSMPIPQWIELVKKSEQLKMSPTLEDRLQSAHYYSQIILLLMGLTKLKPQVLHKKTQSIKQIISQIKNHTDERGLSTIPGCWSILSTSDWAKQNWALSTETIAQRLKTAFYGLFEDTAEQIRQDGHWQVHRWRYSQIENPFQDPFFSLQTTSSFEQTYQIDFSTGRSKAPQLYLIGDAFGQANLSGIERAFCSASLLSAALQQKKGESHD